MVGIVIVSHSRRIAEGAAELARQMAGEDVVIEATGGLNEPGDPIGTDAMLVLAAIERAWSEDGVLVLMDLGSAVLSTEMALDFLAEERRAKVRLTGAPVIEGAVAAAVAAKIGGTLDDVEREAIGGLAGKASHLGVEPNGVGATGPAAAGQDEGPEERIEIEVSLPHGLHARPAARFVQTVSGFDAAATVRNVTTGRGPVSGRSLNAVATLGVTVGQSIEVVARGPQAAEVVKAVRALAERRFDEEAETAVDAAPAAHEAAVPADGVVRGVPASPGFAVAPARRFHVPQLPSPSGTPDGDVPTERATLRAAIDEARLAIQRQREDTIARLGPASAAIFEAHLLFLEDEALRVPAFAAIDAGTSAGAAWMDAVGAMAAQWDALDDLYLRARAVDLRGVGQQVLAALLGVDLPRPALDAPGILVAVDLEPADTAALDPATCLGIATQRGGPTSHAAVLARALGIPAVVGAGDALGDVVEGTVLGLDASAGLIHVDPPADEVTALETARDERAARETDARRRATEPASTRDGTGIEVAANIGTPAEAVAAAAAGCDGVGLFRTEFLFLGRDRMPDEDEQEAAYREAAVALGGRPMIVRTLDAGADKPLPFLGQPQEANPFLGVRGIRLGLAEPEILGVQLRALLRVAVDHPVRIMFPMVATLEEVGAARAALDAARLATGVDARPEVGLIDRGARRRPRRRAPRPRGRLLLGGDERPHAVHPGGGPRERAGGRARRPAPPRGPPADRARVRRGSDERHLGRRLRRTRRRPGRHAAPPGARCARALDGCAGDPLGEGCGAGGGRGRGACARRSCARARHGGGGPRAPRGTGPVARGHALRCRASTHAMPTAAPPPS